MSIKSVRQSANLISILKLKLRRTTIGHPNLLHLTHVVSSFLWVSNQWNNESDKIIMIMKLSKKTALRSTSNEAKILCVALEKSLATPLQFIRICFLHSFSEHQIANNYAIATAQAIKQAILHTFPAIYLPSPPLEWNRERKKSVESRGLFMKIRQKWHQLPQVCERSQLSSSCFTASVFPFWGKWCVWNQLMD